MRDTVQGRKQRSTASAILPPSGSWDPDQEQERLPAPAPTITDPLAGGRFDFPVEGVYLTALHRLFACVLNSGAADPEVHRLGVHLGRRFSR